MSESMKCDNCDTTGRRRRGHHCPEGWFYCLSRVEDGYDQYLMSTCSEKCRDAIWQNGPGKISAEEMLSPIHPPPVPGSDPELIFDALAESMAKRDFMQVTICKINGKYMITCTDRNKDDYVGLDESVVEAFKEAFRHQDIINEG